MTLRGNKTHLFDRKMAEHELNGQIKSASLARQHIVTSENSLKGKPIPSSNLNSFASYHCGISRRDKMSLKGSLNSVLKLQSGSVNVAGAAVNTSQLSDGWHSRFGSTALFREQKDTVSVVHLANFLSVPWEK